MNVCLLWVLCVVRYRSLRRADHLSTGVLPTVVRRCVWSRNLKNEEAMTRVGSQRHRKKTATCFGSSYRAIFKLSPKNCYIQLAMFYRVGDVTG
jgi:hypothetical protein